MCDETTDIDCKTGERHSKKILRYTLHSLRHFHASMLIASGATAKEIQVEMGHSSIQMTFDTYGHLFPDDEEKRRERAVAIEAELSTKGERATSL